MHQPGYVQGGQGVGRSYLLLRIHVRRIRGIDITVIIYEYFSTTIEGIYWKGRMNFCRVLIWLQSPFPLPP
jgi:hypothetical protein